VNSALIPDKPDRAPAGSKSRSRLFRAAVILLLALVVCGGLLAAGYVRQVALSIHKAYETAAAHSPVYVYGQAVHLESGMVLSPEVFKEALVLLRYVYSDALSRPGQYRQTGSEFDIYIRNYPEERVRTDEIPIRVSFEGGKIAAITDLKKKG